MKKIITIIAIAFISGLAMAQSPSLPQPNTGTNNTTDGKTANVRSEAVRGPVGTATALLVTLGAGAVAYRVRKGKKVEE